MKRILLIIFIGAIASASFAQRHRIDSLLGEIKTNLPDTMRMRVYYQLGKDYLRISSDSSMSFIQNARQFFGRLTGGQKIALGLVLIGGFSILGGVAYF